MPTPSAPAPISELEHATADAIEADGVGLGVGRHVRTRRMVGHALLWDDALVHASDFAMAA